MPCAHGIYDGLPCPYCIKPTKITIHPGATMAQTETRAASDVDVIAALRLAVEGTDDWERLGQMTDVILNTARETPDDNTGGVELLLRLHREGKLRFELSDPVNG